jgi:hypothetical protein
MVTATPVTPIAIIIVVSIRGLSSNGTETYAKAKTQLQHRF